MAKKKSTIADLPVNSTLIKSREDVIALITTQIRKAEDLLNMEVQRSQGYGYGALGGGDRCWNYNEKQKEAFFAAYKKWHDMNKEIFTRSFADANNTDLRGYEYAGQRIIYTGDEDIVKEQCDEIREKVSFMEGFIEKINLIPCSTESTTTKTKAVSNKVFIVHGHDVTTRTEVENFVRSIGYEPIILCKRADMGDTIIEKIERESQDVCYAIVIYTSCDLGKYKECADLKPRARQNVVFEHGFMCAKLGRPNVVALLENGVEQPGDLQGIIYKSLDDRGLWKYDIAREMSAIGLHIDFSKIG